LPPPAASPPPASTTSRTSSRRPRSAPACNAPAARSSGATRPRHCREHRSGWSMRCASPLLHRASVASRPRVSRTNVASSRRMARTSALPNNHNRLDGDSAPSAASWNSAFRTRRFPRSPVTSRCRCFGGTRTCERKTWCHVWTAPVAHSHNSSLHPYQATPAPHVLMWTTCLFVTSFRKFTSQIPV
jgi:hypothetical protein